MESIGVRELRQHASKWLRRVQRGESFQVTEYGRPVALLIPSSERNILETLSAAGRVSVPQGDLLDMGPPVPAREGEQLPSELLQAARELER
jgi:prevent-host-death family protein